MTDTLEDWARARGVGLTLAQLAERAERDYERLTINGVDHFRCVRHDVRFRVGLETCNQCIAFLAVPPPMPPDLERPSYWRETLVPRWKVNGGAVDPYALVGPYLVCDYHPGDLRGGEPFPLDRACLWCLAEDGALK